MRRLATLLFMAVCSLLGPLAHAEKSQAWTWCEGGKDVTPDLQISGCTSVILGGRETTNNLSIAFNNRGNGYTQKKDDDKALSDFNQALRINPKNSLTYRNRANLHRRAKRYDNALSDYNDAIRLRPDYARAYDDRGDMYLEQKQFDLAIDSYEQAVKYEPGNAVFWADRGVGRIRKWDAKYRTIEEEMDEAEGRNATLRADLGRANDDLNQAVKLKPDSDWALRNRCFLNVLRKQFSDAIQDCSEAIRIDPTSAYAWHWRGYSFLKQNKYAQAISDADEAVRLGPGEAERWNFRGNVYFAKSNDAADMSKALENYSQAISIRPTALFFKNRGAAQRMLKDFPAAVKDYSEALRLDADYYDALLGRSQAYAGMRDSAKAEEDAVAAAQLREKLGL
jgi:tetratricopeptide (TPR) repeat protein